MRQCVKLKFENRIRANDMGAYIVADTCTHTGARHERSVGSRLSPLPQAPLSSSQVAATMTITGALVLVLFLGLNVSAFYAPGNRAWQTNRHVTSTTSFSSPSADVEAHGTDAPLVFSLNSVFSSDPVPAASPRDILEFFQDPAQRNCMVSAGNEREVEEVQESAIYFDVWKRISRELGAAEPDKSDSILRVVTGGMHFPGLTLTSEAYIGAKLLEHSDDDDYPVYEFSLLMRQAASRGVQNRGLDIQQAYRC